MFSRSSARGARAMLAFAFVVAFSACSDSPASRLTADDADLARRSDVTIEVQLGSSDIARGATTRAVAVVRDRRGNVLRDRSVTWSSLQSSVAKVDSAGLVTGLSAGTTTIRATSGDASAGSTLVVSTTSAATADPSECGSPKSGWIFCDDFEQDRTAKYYEYDNAGGKFVRASGTGLSGSVGMKATYTKGQTSAGHLSLAMGRTPSSYFKPADAGTANYRELYWRFYTLRGAGWVGDGPAKLTRATILAKSDWSQAMIAHGWTDDTDKRYLLLDPASGTDANGQVITSGYNDFAHLRWLGPVRSSTPLEDAAHVNQWQCYEFHVKLNTAGQSDGVFELSVNDTVSARRTGLNWIGSYNAYGLNAVLLEQYQGEGAPAANVRVIDNFVVSTKPIGCRSGSSSGSSGSSTAVASVAISPSAPSGTVGQTIQLSATAGNSNGEALTGRSVTWASANPAVATVNASGLVSLVSAGSATISATSEGVRGEVTVTASKVAVVTVQAILKLSKITTGATTQATATVLDASGATLTGRTVTWSSSNTAVATVSSAGVVTGVKAGTANVVATSEGKSGSAAITVASPVIATSVGITRQPSATATSGTAFAQQPVVQLRDASGNAVSQSGVIVTAAIATGGGTLGGTATATTNASGSATFSGLSITGTAGNRTLSFSASGLTAATSSTIAIAAGTSTGGSVGSTAEPKPSGTIVLDTRAGGAHDIQKANSIADARAYWAKSGGPLNGIGFTTDYDGKGKHAFRVDWQANPGRESSFNDNAFYFPSQSAIYTSVVVHLGRTATGGGVGNIGSFVPVTSGGGMKRILWLRQRDNGTDRVYWNWPTGGQGAQQNDLTIDNRNFDSYFNADYGIGVDVRWTFAIIPGNPGTLRVWRNGVLVHENTKAAIGTLPISQMQFITTRFNATQAETEYWTDLVVWNP
jgi:uncharacterized protein YjdB